MRYFTLLFIIFPFAVQANISQQEYESILTKSIYKEMYQRVKKIPVDDEVEEIIIPKKMSKGAILIEQMKAKNRAKIARMRGLDPSKVKSGKDIVSGQKEATKQFIKKISKIRKEQERLKNRALTTNEWKLLYKKLYDQWEEEKREFVRNLPKYQENQFEIPVIIPTKKEIKKKKTIQIDEEFLFVAHSLEIPIRDQKFRPTCSSFAGIRAIEIMQKQRQVDRDLSEQFFYWASKPTCRTQKCNEKGSWVGYGLDYLKQHKDLIPQEQACPYTPYSVNYNETQIPLLADCYRGRTGINGYYYIQSLDEVAGQIKQNRAVIIGLKLTPNFYKNHGLILHSEKNMGNVNMDGHASGHAAVIVGVVKLSPYLNEGKYCYVLANSWGAGWAQGGYSCLSEKWILNQKGRNPMVVVY